MEDLRDIIGDINRFPNDDKNIPGTSDTGTEDTVTESLGQVGLFTDGKQSCG